ncbi:MAG: hypothetical protein WC009_13940 [Methylotenera sp.]
MIDKISERETNGIINRINTSIEAFLDSRISLHSDYKDLNYKEKQLRLKGFATKQIMDGVYDLLSTYSLAWFKIFNGDLVVTVRLGERSKMTFPTVESAFNLTKVTSIELSGDEFMVEVHVK